MNSEARQQKAREKTDADTPRSHTMVEPTEQQSLFPSPEGEPSRYDDKAPKRMVMRNTSSLKPHPALLIQKLAPTVERQLALEKLGNTIFEQPLLVTHLGVSGLQTTEQFLALTPEYFRKQLRKLSPQRGRRRWRDDPDLMRFLAGL
jgi:hypothetical protein